MRLFGTFSPKMTYFAQIDPINYYFDQIYVHKTEWNIFYKVLGKELIDLFPKILTYDVILDSKMTLFWPFSPKMTYFDQIYAINDIFDQISVHKPDWKNFLKLLEKKLFYHFPKILTFDVIFASKITLFCPFSPKMTYFDQIYAINDIFDQISVHKPDWNNF